MLGCLEMERRDMPSLPASIIMFPFRYIKRARALVSHLAFLALIKTVSVTVHFSELHVIRQFYLATISLTLPLPAEFRYKLHNKGEI